MNQTTALLLTLLIEVPVAVGLARVLGAPRLALVAGAAVGASLLTHPLLWLSGVHTGMPAALAVAELCVTLVEAVVYTVAAGLGWRRSLVVSAAANLASLLVGLVLS